ncbi:MAG TPA: methionyl-tRNA formyltransferase, partial [Myxococcales bacterium]|nr:methionyl-tRNA formyltransferase [Myxococcales bacterium]
TGVTIMQMDEGLDTGDVRLQRACDIAADETGESLLARLSALGAETLDEALRRLERGELQRIPQDHSRATLAPPLTREDGRVDFSRPARELDQRRRGFTPWPGAWTTVDGAVLKIHAALPLEHGGAKPGEIVATGAPGIDVGCGRDTLWRLVEVQPEGKRSMPAAAYLAGHRLSPGDRLGT